MCLIELQKLLFGRWLCSPYLCCHLSCVLIDSSTFWPSLMSSGRWASIVLWGCSLLWPVKWNSVRRLADFIRVINGRSETLNVLKWLGLLLLLLCWLLEVITDCWGRSSLHQGSGWWAYSPLLTRSLLLLLLLLLVSTVSTFCLNLFWHRIDLLLHR